MDIYYPGKLKVVISFVQMCYPLYKETVLRRIMGYEHTFFNMQAEFLVISGRLNALVCYESCVS